MKKLSVLILAVMLTACGGSGGDEPSVVPLSSTPTSDTPAAVLQWNEDTTWNASKWK